MLRDRLTLLILLCAACSSETLPQQRYYDQHIQPIFNNFCVGNTSPCHRDAGGGVALGNLDLTSFEAVKRRPDVLRNYGSYPQPLLLLKSLPEASVLLPYRGMLHESAIRHAGGKTIAPNSDAYFELKRWLDAGATRDGLPQPAGPNQGRGACNSTIPAGASITVDASSQAYRLYAEQVEPLLHGSCAFGTCHSSPQSDFYITCGGDEVQRRFNFLQAASFVVGPGTSIEQSELLLRPLSPEAGGVSHTGGVFFQSQMEEAWQRLRTWALEVQKNPPPVPPRSTGQQFFEAQVMPVLLARGCALEGCHSPSGFNDYRLRSGARGFFSSGALTRNYETTLHEFMSIDTPDVKQSRAVKKTIFPSSGGIPHRGGPVLETPGRNVSDPCPTPFDPATASAFCVLSEWHRIERQDRAGDVSRLAAGDVVPIAFVARPANGDGPLAFDTFRGGAELRLADAHIGAAGRVDSVDNVRSACASLAGRTDLDVRGPEWSYDGARLVFSVRQGTAGGHDIWTLDLGSGVCTERTSDHGRLQGTVKVHNFDPVFTPEGGIVFASTRTGTLTLKKYLPNADLFRVPPSLDFGAAEPMTFLLGSELSPAFMQDGRLTFTAEKATRDFYQLSGRRINWDLTDYHPLLAQRAQSDDTFGQQHDSIGYGQATEIREDLDRNFLVILSNEPGVGGGGVLATFNRSIGPFERGREEVTFLKSVVFLGTAGLFRSPYPLPNGEILASHATDTTTPRYDLVAVGSGGGQRTLLSGGGDSLVEAAMGYERASRLLFRNLPQLIFGGHGSDPAIPAESAVMHFPDVPMLATLLGANLRRGRNLVTVDRAVALRVYEELPPPSAGAPGTTYERRNLLGSASLEADRSLKVALPSRKPLILELVDGAGQPVFTMKEEHQLGPGEYVTPGVQRSLFNGVCGGCHGSISGRELDIAVTADALTGASVSASRDQAPKPLR